MITLANIRDFLKRFDLFEHYYIGKLDNKQDKSLGIYSFKRNEPTVTAIGGDSSYDIKGVSLLIHYNNNADETEIAALRLFEKLRTVKDVTIGNTQIYMIQLLMPEPVDVGTDDKGVYERVIEMKIYYERKN